MVYGAAKREDLDKRTRNTDPESSGLPGLVR